MITYSILVLFGLIYVTLVMPPRSVLLERINNNTSNRLDRFLITAYSDDGGLKWSVYTGIIIVPVAYTAVILIDLSLHRHTMSTLYIIVSLVSVAAVDIMFFALIMKGL